MEPNSNNVGKVSVDGKDEIKANNTSPPVGPKMANNSIPTIPPPRIPPIPPPGAVSRVAYMGRPPLEKASSMPEKPGIGTPVSAGSYNSSRNSSIEKSSSIDKSYGSKDALSGGKDRPPLPSYEEALERSKHHNDTKPLPRNPPTSLDRCDWEIPSRSRDKDSKDNRDNKDYSKDYSTKDYKEQETSAVRRRRGSKEYNRYASVDGVLMVTDENNIPQIDVAITPPHSPAKEPLQAHSARVNKPFGMRTPKLKRFPSLKFCERFGSIRRRGSERESSNQPESPREINPTITITMDDDADSIISDYLHPDHNYKRDRNIRFIGDDISLYGTPKEEMSPLKEPSSPPPASPRTSYLKDQIISFFQPSDNKLAMKLFGNKNALMKEKLRQKAAGNWVIHPCSNFR